MPLASNTARTVFGTGDTAPAFDDYWLSGDIITSLSGSSALTTSSDADGTTLTALFTLTNTGSEDVTIKELGVTAYFPAMIDRTVLDSPVTIPVGGVGQVTYTIRMNYPT